LNIGIIIKKEVIMKKHIKMESIEQLRHIVQQIKHEIQYLGKNENDEAVYDKNKELPTLIATGYEKIHGTQMSVSYNNIDGFWIQSKNKVLSLEEDNAKCYYYNIQIKDAWIQIINQLATHYNIDLNKNTITIFSEWAGANIQKNTCVEGLERMAFIFEYFKVTENDTDNSKLLPTNNLKDMDNNIRNVTEFKRWKININFNNLKENLKEIEKIIGEVENNSPIASYFNTPKNIGEGIVWSLITPKKTLYFLKQKEKNILTALK
jgi:archaellin